MFMQVYGIDLSMEKFDVNFIDAKGNEKIKEVKNQPPGLVFDEFTLLV